ncbi:MAG: ATP-binding cassette domain-containing protein, partial [Burkholderiaceae bacterium]
MDPRQPEQIAQKAGSEDQAEEGMTELVIDVRGLTTRFGRQVVHDRLDLQIRRGELVALIGGSGTGKSVLVREIIGLQRPTAGDVHVLGTSMWTASEPELARVRRR